jgi:myo-inositol-1(or 4)-monophosphatase
MILERIAREFPADAAITEETQAAPGRHAAVAVAKRCWVIDPIDGTRNYARGVPIFTVSIALMEAGSPVVGVIHDPMTGRMYSASLGGGTWVDGERASVADEPMPGGLLIAVPSARRAPLPEILHRWMNEMVLRNTGSTALHLALVGCGAIDAAYSDDCRLWDVAAGALIATEGGAAFTSPDGKRQFPMDLSAYKDQDVAFIAAPPKLAARMVAEYRASQGK